MNRHEDGAEAARNVPRDEEAEDRSLRSSGDREDSERPLTWSQPDILPMPDPQEGWSFRYIRTSMMGKEDNRNVSIRFREGWEPVSIDDYPELMVVSDYDSHWGKKGAVEIGGLLLCKIPTEIMEDRKRQHKAMTDGQMGAIDNNLMREEDPRMATLTSDRSSKVSFGKGA